MIDLNTRRAVANFLQTIEQNTGARIVNACVSPKDGAGANALQARIAFLRPADAYAGLVVQKLPVSREMLPGTEVELLVMDVRDAYLGGIEQSSADRAGGYLTGASIQPYLDALSAEPIVQSSFMIEMAPRLSEVGAKVRESMIDYLSLMVRLGLDHFDRAPAAPRPVHQTYAFGRTVVTPAPEAQTNARDKFMSDRLIAASAMMAALARGPLPPINQIELSQDMVSPAIPSLNQVLANPAVPSIEALHQLVVQTNRIVEAGRNRPQPNQERINAMFGGFANPQPAAAPNPVNDLQAYTRIINEVLGPQVQNAPQALNGVALADLDHAAVRNGQVLPFRQAPAPAPVPALPPVMPQALPQGFGPGM